MGDIIKVQADNSSLIIGEDTDATGSPITRIQDMNPHKLKVTELSLDLTGEDQESESLSSGYAAVFGELAGIGAEGNINMELPEGEGMLDVVNGGFGDRAPISTPLPNKQLIPAGTRLFKNVVSGENLAGAADKRIHSNLRSIPQAINLRISLYAATLISSGTAGTVKITYDVAGTETTETRSFATGAPLTTPQNWELPANAKVTRVQTTGFSGGTFAIDALISVVTNHDLTTADATVANTLSTYPQMFVLVLIPSSTADLTHANTPATVVISYTATGITGTQTVTKTFTSANKTAPQTLKLPANATVTAVAVAGWSAGTLEIQAVCPLFDEAFFTNTDKIQLSVVHGDNLDSNDAINVADDLHAYAEPLQLTVTPSENATVASAATIVIHYNIEGISYSGTLNFTTATQDDAQTFDLPADAVITSVTRSGWGSGSLVDITVPIAANRVLGAADAYPGKLNFTLSQANPNGQLVIKGLRKVGLKSDDVLRMNEMLAIDATGTTIETSRYFFDVVTMTLSDTTGVPYVLGTLHLTSQPGGYKTVLKMADKELLKYTGEGEVGGEPWLFTQMMFTEINVENGTTVRLNNSIIARRVDRRRTLEGGWIEKFIGESTVEKYKNASPANPVTTPDGTEITANPFPEMQKGFFSSVGGALEIDGEATIYSAAPISINHNYGRDDEKAGSLILPLPERQGRRQVTASISAKYVSGTSDEDKFIRWDEKYVNKEPVHVRVYQFRWASNGRIKAYIWDMPYCEITAPVRAEATGPGTIPITIAVRATPVPNAASQEEITLTLINDDHV